MEAAPNTVRVDYLFQSWLDKYHPHRTDTKFLPSHNLEQEDNFSRYYLDYCLRFPICNHIVLGMLSDEAMRSSSMGNILASMIPDDEATVPEWMRASDERPCKLGVFPVRQLPKRLANAFDGSSTTFPEGVILAHPEEQASTTTPCKLYQLLSTFGPTSELLPLPDLLVLLRVLLLHWMESNSPRKSPAWQDEGFSLIRCVLAKSKTMVNLLLTLGADPRQRKNMSIQIAARKDWAEGLKLLVEQSQSQRDKRERAIVELRQWYLECEATNNWQVDGTSSAQDETQEQPPVSPVRSSRKRSRSPTQAADGSASSSTPDVRSERARLSTGKVKRRRLSDRVKLDSVVLREAIKAGASDVVEYLVSLRLSLLIAVQWPRPLTDPAPPDFTTLRLASGQREGHCTRYAESSLPRTSAGAIKTEEQEVKDALI